MANRGLSLSKKQFCDIRGWTSSEFDKAVREGMPVAEHPNGRGTDYVVFMGDVIRWIVAQELKAAGHESGEAVALDLNAERARLAKEQADKTELENRLARKELLPAAEVAKAEEIIFAALRDRIMAVESVAPLLHDAALKEGERGLRPVLRQALHDALKEVGSAELKEADAA
jgi:phage terminase Nu1 subunit (DNA packaging protein)